MIKRQKYLDLLLQYKDKPYIKVLTGIRRVGKSTLLQMFVEELKAQGVDESLILMLNFELPQTFDIKDYEVLTTRVLEFSKGKKENMYLLLDEVGRVEDWEKAINAFHAMGSFDLYITGSNADMLSSELSTYLAGRYVELLIHPFSYKEFLEMNPKSTFQDYIIYGGIPAIQSFHLQYDFSMNALRDSFKSAVLQDVITRHQIRNAYILEKLIQYVFSNVGKTFSALSISNYFKSQRISVSVDTILSYLGLIQDAFLIYKVRRNDVIGKRILKTEEKYYIADHGFREALTANNMAVIESVLENIVYIELLRRGYKVYVGKVDQYEVDFVAIKGKEVEYYQIAYLMELESTREREFGVYDMIHDHFPKFVISMDQVDFSRNGIRHLHIEDFLLNQ